MKYQSFCSSCDWDVTLQLTWILTQTQLPKCVRVASAFLCEYIKYEENTNLPLFLQESKPIQDDSRWECSSQTSQKKDFWQSEFCTTRALLFSPCCSDHVNTIESLGNQKLPLTAVLHLTETRLFLKLVMPYVLLQWTMVAKKAHQLRIQQLGQAGKDGEGGSWITGMYRFFFLTVYFSRVLKNCWVIQLKIQVSVESRKWMTNLMRHCRSLKETELGQNPMLVDCN